MVEVDAALDVAGLHAPPPEVRGAVERCAEADHGRKQLFPPVRFRSRHVRNLLLAMHSIVTGICIVNAAVLERS
ncbi:hypothetical protein [Streptomyces sp. x-19]|uniref:hypothetical protein n=1 Tax=Streptomyces sp. x-19 TaxID=2789280 RepID=UPI00397FD7BD